MKIVAAGTIDAIVNALTKPLTAEEAKGEAAVSEKVETILKFTGKTYGEAAEAVNEGFLARQWADGLPIVPPTQEAVRWMLSGTSRSPNEVIGVPVVAKGGKATIEKIAINAVMAGAKPEFLPVIIAAMEVLTDKNYHLIHLQASAGGISPLIFVNGPIATELGINSGIGYLGHGNRPNNTIGRAVRLCLINLGHMWPGVNDMSLEGRTAAFGNWTFAENEKESPWKPYHVDSGFKSEDSTVTVSSAMFKHRGPGGPVSPANMSEALVAISRIMEILRYPADWINLTNGYPEFVIAIDPTFAQRLAKMGFSKNDVQKWLYLQARMPYSELTETEKKRLKEGVEKGTIPPHVWLESGYKDKSAGLLPRVWEPEAIRIIVAGGAPGYIMVWHYTEATPPERMGHGTKKITGATLTNAGR